MRTLAEDVQLVLVMVGLPARGKTYIARKLARYLNWLGVAARVFNVGNYRRKHLGSHQPASFFDPDNPEGAEARRRMALAALDDLVQWLQQGGGKVGIYDATNGTPERRQLVRARLADAGVHVVFVESICNDQALVEANIVETKLSMPDYADADPEEAVRDFRARIANYTRSYRPVEEAEGSFVKLIDVGEKIELHRIRGSLPARIVVFLMNLHLVPRPILLTRHGQSTFNPQDRIGGDPPLTAEGWAFARRLGPVLQARLPEPPVVWSSTLRRAIQTATSLSWPVQQLKNLDEIDAGVFDGWTYERIEKERPEEFAARKADKLNYRYPRGESYTDVIDRLDPVIVELERQRRPVVIVAHQAVLRCLYGYLTDRPPADCPYLDVPLHTAIELLPKAYGAHETRLPVTPGAEGQ